MAGKRLNCLPEPGPRLRPLEYVSPSRVAALEACFLQAAFGADPAYRKLIFRGPRGLLGAACHALLERVWKGELASEPEGGRRQGLERIWGEEVARAEEAAQHPSAPTRHLGPARRWPGYALQRARVLRRAEALLGRRRTVGRGGDSGAFSERGYRAYGGRMRGRADLVRSVQGRVEIEDYKTGEIYEEAEIGGAQALLKPRLRRQLLLYAAMHHSETGEWPRSGHIVPLAGERASIEVDPYEAAQEAEAALELLDRFNAQVARGQGSGSLASPSEDACRLCSFKAFCEPFWMQVSASWTWGGVSATIEGVVLQANIGGTGNWTAKVRVERGNVERGTYTVRGSRDIGLGRGERLRAVNLLLKEAEGSPTLVVTSYTELWTYPPI